jgi:hypothetical protein
MKRSLKVWFNVVTNEFIQENPCYCGGYVRSHIVAKGGLKIINCFPNKIDRKHRFDKRFVELSGWFNEGTTFDYNERISK